jgi:DNA (cytosine-5)-methyltransferase 1
MLVTPFLASYHTETNKNEVRGLKVDEPIHTLDTSNRFGLITPYISKFYKTGVGQEIKEPLHTVTTSQGHFGEVAPFLTTYYKNNSDIGQDATEPLRTVTVKDRFGFVSVKVSKVASESNLGYWPKVRDLLNKYCGYNLADDEILLLNIEGVHYFIYDIGLRMLSPRELFKANGLPDDYIIDHDYTGKIYPKKDQVARCGNAVPPPFAKALVEANLPELCHLKVRREA